MKMKTPIQLAAVLVLVGAGMFAARAADTREVKIERGHTLALVELGRRGQELDAARRQWEALSKQHQADTAAVHSEIRARYQLAESEVFQKIDPEKDILTVGHAAAAPVAGTR